MSLDVYLYQPNDDMPPADLCLVCATLTDEQRDSVYESHAHEHLVFTQNITHNLGKMASKAGVYEVCWRPEELMDAATAARINALEDQYFANQRDDTRHLYDEAQEMRAKLAARVRASHIAPLLREGIAKLRLDPAHFRQFEPENKWGTYDSFIPWLEAYLAACEAYPDARVRVSR